MKRMMTLLLLIMTIPLSYAQGTDETVSVTLDMSGILNRQGNISIKVFNSEATYLKSSYVSMKIGLSEHEGNTFFIHDLPKGEYAIAVMHDENENGELDFGGMGPIEGYGFSNNPDASFGPAPYAEAKLDIAEDTLLTIALN